MIDPWIRNLPRDALLSFPSFVQQCPKGITVPGSKGVQHAVGKRTHLVKCRNRRAGLAARCSFLFLQDGPRVMGRSRKKEHQSGLKVPKKVGVDLEWLHLC